MSLSAMLDNAVEKVSGFYAVPPIDFDVKLVDHIDDPMGSHMQSRGRVFGVCMAEGDRNVIQLISPVNPKTLLHEVVHGFHFRYNPSVSALKQSILDITDRFMSDNDLLADLVEAQASQDVKSLVVANMLHGFSLVWNRSVEYFLASEMVAYGHLGLNDYLSNGPLPQLVTRVHCRPDQPPDSIGSVNNRLRMMTPSDIDSLVRENQGWGGAFDACHSAQKDAVMLGSRYTQYADKDISSVSFAGSCTSGPEIEMTLYPVQRVLSPSEAVARQKMIFNQDVSGLARIFIDYKVMENQALLATVSAALRG